MHARHSADYPPLLDGLVESARNERGEFVTVSRYPVVDVEKAWDLSSMLGIEVPGIVYGYEETGQQRTTWLAHPDGSWARATSKEGALLSCTRAVRATCGTFWTTSVRTGLNTANCPYAAPMC
ncbi:hypothetical protein OHA44_35065 [Streptomyces sp. NBC_00144]|uniref:hypothetical protein n=1 Tax=Streptomyces sp. NBC_00144 TaxID=2975665 RepID=UPI00325255B6